VLSSHAQAQQKCTTTVDCAQQAVAIAAQMQITVKSLSDKVKVDQLEQKIGTLKSEINGQFETLPQIQNAGHQFNNASTLTGAGNDPSSGPPGRCPLGQVVVRVQARSGGKVELGMQCGAIPHLHVN
jgi:hypothetical protein